MEAVLDTNIVVSAAISPKGPPAEIIKAWRAHQFTWVTSDSLLAELEAVLLRPQVKKHIAWSDREMSDCIESIRRAARIVSPAIQLAVVEHNPADNRVLEAAVEGNAEYVVTGDRHLLKLGRHEQISIVTAARLVAIITTGLS